MYGQGEGHGREAKLGVEELARHLLVSLVAISRGGGQGPDASWAGLGREGVVTCLSAGGDGLVELEGLVTCL